MRLCRFKKNDQVLVGRYRKDSVVEYSKKDIFSPGKETDKVHGLEELEFLPPATPSKIVCIGFNYAKHRDEAKEIATKNPTLTLKAPNAIIGSDKKIILPSDSNQVEHEAELGIVIGKEGHRIEDPGKHVYGYTVVNDVTARDLEKEMIQWSASKSYPTFCPTGPSIATGIDASDLGIKCWVDGELRQDDSTGHMIYSPLECVRFASRFMKLEKGDLIATGTIPGTGLLEENSVVDIEIEGIGVLSNPVSRP